MQENKIRELLEQLQAELEKSGSIDDQGRKMIEHITTDIKDLLDGSAAEVDESMVQRLQDSIDHFKMEHPSLTMALSEVMSILSNAGI